MKPYLTALLFVVFTASILTNQSKAQSLSNESQEKVFNPHTNSFEPIENSSLIKQAVNSANENSQILSNEECRSGFWSIDPNGNIQKWDLINNAISGGSIVLSGAGKGLSYCGSGPSQTFYSTIWHLGSGAGVKYYNSTSGWNTILNNYTIINDGGTGKHQYFMGMSGSIPYQLLYYDGINVNIAYTLAANEYFALADIAVDSVGRAWVFIGQSFTQAAELRIYNKTQGLVNTYPINNMSSMHMYGSFYQNGKVYVGCGSSGAFPNTLIPISINNGVAQMGTPIPFPNSDFYDLASCNFDYTIGVDEYANELSNLTIAPNPNKGIFDVTTKNEIKSVAVYNALGQEVYYFKNDNKINSLKISLDQMPEGSYIIKVYDGINYIHKKIIIYN